MRPVRPENESPLDLVPVPAPVDGVQMEPAACPRYLNQKEKTSVAK